MKNIKKYIKLYLGDAEKSKTKYGYYYPPRNWEDFEFWLNRTFQKHFVDEPNEELNLEARLYVTLLADHFVRFGYFSVFNKTPLDFQYLNDVIYQTARSEHLDVDSFMVTGNRFHHILSAFASNDTEPADTFVPDDYMCSTRMFYTDMAVNLFLIYYRKRDDLREEIIPLANKFLAGKRSVFDKSVVEYFLALIDKDATKASTALQNICVGYQKRGDVDKKDKLFLHEVHGLYRMVKFVDEDLFLELTQPQHPAFFNDFEDWQKQNNYPKGKLAYTYPPQMNLLNKILQAKLPALSIDELIDKEMDKIFADKILKDINSR